MGPFGFIPNNDSLGCIDRKLQRIIVVRASAVLVFLFRMLTLSVRKRNGRGAGAGKKRVQTRLGHKTRLPRGGRHIAVAENLG